MSRAATVRQWLAGNASESRPRTMPEMRAALGIESRLLAATLNDMIRCGFVAKVSASRKSGYWLTGMQPKVHAKPERAHLDRRERERLRHQEIRRARGAIPRAEYEARCAEARRLKALDRAQTIVRRMKRAAPKPKPAPVKVAPKVKAVRMPAAALAPAPPKPAAPRAETVAEYLARGGRVERLPVSWNQPQQGMT